MNATTTPIDHHDNVPGMERQRADVAAPAVPAGAVPVADPDVARPHAPEPDAETGLPRADGDAGGDTDSAGRGDADSDSDGDGDPVPAEPTPADIAEQEQAELWRKAQVRSWHQRTWLRVGLVLAAATGAAAIVPYPLRITSECTVIPGERAKVRSELPGVIAEIMIDEGHAVKQGEVIARLDDRALKAERLMVVADIDKIEAELAVLRQGHRREEILQQEAIVAARRNEVEFAAKEAERRGQMVRDGVGAPQAAEAASRDLETRRQAVAEAEAALRLLRAGSRPEEVAAHEAILKRARAELAYVDEKLAMTLVRAPIDGEILTPRFRERLHEGVEAGGLVCEIANTRRMRAEIFTPERDVDAIELGMPAIVKVESYPTHRFEGKVGFIAPAVEGDDRRVRVVVELDNAAGMLKANMTGYGEVEAGDHSLLQLATRRMLRWIRVRYLL
jgi:multidrug efflux pump subunit AcrA (membrane-fusion protein)